MAGEGYVVHAQATTESVFPLSPSCPSLTLMPGLNLVGHPSPPAGLSCYGWLMAFGPDTVTALQRFNSTTGAFETCAFRASEPSPVGADFPIRPGEGYLLRALVRRLVQLPGCSE